MKSEVKKQSQKNILIFFQTNFFKFKIFRFLSKPFHHALRSSLFAFRFNNPWIIALFLLGVFLITNGYTYGWDDQHVEIPLLKKLIDPTLYPNDYYVDALKTNFMSYLYPILSKIITTDQIPSTYIFLYLLSRYFLFFFIYKIWHKIGKHRGIAVTAVLMIILLGRVEEFLYRTFSHQEFALAFIFAGIYYFYKERFLISALLLGLAANFHSLYALFPICYLGFYLLWQKDWKNLLKSCAGFIITALPFLIWAGTKYFEKWCGFQRASPLSEWIPLYQLACPQNFLFHHSSLTHITASFQNFWNGTGAYWLIIICTLLNALFTPIFKRDKKSHAVLIVGFLLLIFSFIFSYIYPSRFILDLNLIRNTQFMMFILMGYMIIFLWSTYQKNAWKFFACITLLPIMRLNTYLACISIIIMILIMSLKNPKYFIKKIQYIYLSTFSILIGTCVWLIISSLQHQNYSKITWLTFWSIEGGILLCALFYKIQNRFKHQIAAAALIIPFLIIAISFSYYHQFRNNLEKTGTGFWQLQRNWIDMQNYVRENTPKNALLLVPHDMEMGGFRIRSERSIVMSYRDCGIIGFDYNAAKQWQQRLNEIEPFQVIIQKPLNRALVTALLKYKVDYIVFMKYYSFPNNPVLKQIYQNDTFKLYKVKK